MQMSPGKLAAQQKPCPKGAYLGLCEEGLVSNVAPGHYTRSVRNKHYALRGAELLRTNPSKCDDIASLWHHATQGSGVGHNGQMDVVVALHEAGLLRSA